MPIYEYHCDACTHNFEVIQKISDEKLTYCPECGEHKLRKMVTAAAFRLKGSGWYETDFKDKSKSKSAGSDDKGAKDAGKSETKKTEPAKKAAETSGSKKAETG